MDLAGFKVKNTWNGTDGGVKKVDCKVCGF